MTIEVELSGAEFRRFTIFDLLRRRKQWRGPVLFALILGVSAVLCFSKSETQGAVFLGNVLLTVGLGLPCIYFGYFFSSLNRQVQKQGLTRPQHVYTVTLEDKSKGILADNGKEQLSYEWKSVHHAYRNLTATYLYLTPQRALLLPHSCLEDPDKLWALITKKLPKEKCTVL